MWAQFRQLRNSSRHEHDVQTKLAKDVSLYLHTLAKSQIEPELHAHAIGHEGPQSEFSGCFLRYTRAYDMAGWASLTPNVGLVCITPTWHINVGSRAEECDFHCVQFSELVADIASPVAHHLVQHDTVMLG